MAASFFSAAFVIPWRMAASTGDVSHLVFVLLLSSALFNTAGAIVPLMRAPTRTFGRSTVIIASALAVVTWIGNEASGASAALVSAPILSVLLRSQVLWVALMAGAFMGERVSAAHWVGIGVAALGMIILHDPMSLAHGGVDAVGSVLAVVASLCFGSMLLISRRWRARIEPLSVNAVRMWLAVAVWLAVNGLPSAAVLTPRLVGLGALAAFFGPTCSRGLSLYAVRDIPAGLMALIELLAPVQATVFAWIILGEVPAPMEMAGAFLVLVGIAVPVLRSAR